MQKASLSYGYSFQTAVSLALALSVLYVAVIYTHKPQSAKRAPNGAVDRNDPAVVRFRLSVISALTVFTLAVVPVTVAKMGGRPVGEVYAEMGILPGFVYDEGLHFSLETLVLFQRDICQALVLVCVLFVGPLFNDIFFSGDSPLDIVKEWTSQLSTIHGLRDLVVAPLTEEIVYTSACVVILYQVPHITANSLVFIPPLFFSVAHFHHAYELYTTNVPLNIIVFSTLFQMLYTFLFGIFTDYLFIRQTNLWSCFVAHSFCNFMGVPRLTVDTTKFKYWNYCYYTLLVVGIYAFKHLLGPLTESGLALPL